MKIICLNLLGILIISSCSLKRVSNDDFNNKRLIIYPVLNDSSIIHKTDNLWSDNYSCLKLKIDTIDVKHIRKIRNDKEWVQYKGKMYNKKQIYEIKELDYLKRLEISSFEVASGGTEKKLINDGGCINRKVVNYLNEYFQPKYREMKNIKVYFSDVTVETKNGSINLGGIICFLVFQ